MENAIKLKRIYWGNYRWLFFLVGILFTFGWILGNVKDESGLPISDAARWIAVVLVFPMSWGLGFLPHGQVEQLTVDRSGVSTRDSLSKTIFHRRTFSDRFVPAEDISHIEISEDSEDGVTLHVDIWFQTNTGMPDCIGFALYPDIATATKEADKVAKLLCSEVKVAPSIYVTA
jgi:hypothetical protein